MDDRSKNKRLTMTAQYWINVKSSFELRPEAMTDPHHKVQKNCCLTCLTRSDLGYFERLRSLNCQEENKGGKNGRVGFFLVHGSDGLGSNFRNGMDRKPISPDRFKLYFGHRSLGRATIRRIDNSSNG